MVIFFLSIVYYELSPSLTRRLFESAYKSEGVSGMISSSESISIAIDSLIVVYLFSPFEFFLADFIAGSELENLESKYLGWFPKRPSFLSSEFSIWGSM